MQPDNSNSNEFQKIVYQLLDNSILSLIQYLGNDLKAVDYSHGNSKAEDTKPYIRTCPSVIEQIKESDPSEFPSAFYKKSLSTTSCLSASNPSLQLRKEDKLLITNH